MYSCLTEIEFLGFLITATPVRGGGDLVILIGISLLTEAAQPLFASLLIIHVLTFVRGCFVMVCMWGRGLPAFIYEFRTIGKLRPTPLLPSTTGSSSQTLFQMPTGHLSPAPADLPFALVLSLLPS